jgi:hypothetical protein
MFPLQNTRSSQAKVYGTRVPPVFGRAWFRITERMIPTTAQADALN